MRLFTLLALLLGSTSGCTSPNPRFCGDGTCTDPLYPFCDVDGSVAGTPDVCIAVTCTPMEFQQCRGDAALLCDGTGNNYEVVSCPKGCNATSGCNECSTNDECEGTSPICDTGTGQCIACVDDAQCDSNVCDTSTGACLDPNVVVYAAPDGAGTTCSQEQPCKLVDAVSIARTDSLRKTVRLEPGEYRQSVAIPSGTVTLTGRGATVFGDPASANDIFAVSGTAKVTVRDVTFDTTRASVRCGGTSATKPELRLANLELLINGSFGNGLILHDCTAELFRVRARELSTTLSIPIGAAGNVSLTVVESSFSAPSAEGGAIVMSGKGSSYSFVNSLFDNVSLILENVDDVSTITRLDVAFCTGTAGIYGGDRANEFREIVVENSIFTAPSGDAVGGKLTKFTVRNNVLFPQAVTVGAGNIVADPQFKNATARDFTLQASSPAIDMAMPSTQHNPTVDLVGTARPQGQAHDIGAYEYKP